MNGPCLIYDNGVYKAWFSRDTSASAPVKTVVLYSESTDLINWTTPIVVLNNFTPTFCAYGNIASSVIKEGNTYKMWTISFSSSSTYSVGYTESSDGKHWSTPVQVISIGSFLALNRISVIKEDTGYKAWITVKTTGNLMQVQLATSTDGKTWSSTYTQCSGIKCIGETASTQLFNCVGKENDKYVGLVCDTSGNVYVQTSTDGILWRKCYDNYNSLFLPVGYDATNATKWNVSTTGVVKVGDEWCVVMLGYGKDSVWRLLGGSTKFLVPGNRIICKDLSGKEWCSTLFGGDRREFDLRFRQQ